MAHDLLTLFSPQSLVAFVLVLTRISGMMIKAPLFSTYPVPMQAKAGLVAIVAFIMYPMVVKTSNFTVPPNLVALSLMIGKELIIGSIIGFCAGLIFVAIQVGGHLLSIQMGLSVSNVLDPITKQQSPVVGQMYLYLASIIFLSIQGHQWLFASIYDSYNLIPLGLDFNISGALVERIIFFTSQIFTIAFGIIIPIYGVLFITDVSLGFISKMMPQMNIFMVALPFKIFVGLSMMVIFMTNTAVYLTNIIQSLLKSIATVFM